MNDQPSKSGEGQPSHEAAKIVIPFDIDMSEVESKISQIEQRLGDIKGGKGKQGQPDQIESGSDIFDKFERTIDKFDRIVEESSRQSQRNPGEAFNAANLEKSQSEMQATLARMADLIRQLNDTVLLIYSNLSNRQ